MAINIEEILDRALQVKVANVGTKVLKQLYKPKYIGNLGVKPAPRGLVKTRVGEKSKLVRPRRPITQQPRRPQQPRQPQRGVPVTTNPASPKVNQFYTGTLKTIGALEGGGRAAKATNVVENTKNLIEETARKAARGAGEEVATNIPRVTQDVTGKYMEAASKGNFRPKLLDRDLGYAASGDAAEYLTNSSAVGDVTQSVIAPAMATADRAVGKVTDLVSGLQSVPRVLAVNEGTAYAGRRLASIPTPYNPFRDTQNFISELNRVAREGMPIYNERALRARDMGFSNKEVMRIFREDNPFIDEAVMRNLDLGGILSTPTNFVLSAYSSAKGAPGILRPGRGMLTSVASAPTSEGFRPLQSSYDNLKALLENSFGRDSGLSTGSAALGNIREVVAPAFGATSRTLRAPVADTRILSGIRDIASGGITNQQVFRATNFLEKIPSGRQLSREEFAELIYHLGGDQAAVNTATKILNSRGQASQAVRLTAPGNKSVVKTVSKAVDRARNRLGAQLENQQRINRYHNAYVPRDTMSARDILDRRRFLDTFQDRVLRKTSSVNDNLEDLLKIAYLIGQKLATADFGDNGSSDDMTLSFDNEVKQKIDPKDFASPEDHGNMTPRTNRQTWLGLTDEVNPDKTEATNYKRDYLERT